MRKAYILIHGNLSKIPELKGKISSKDLLICADGAAEFAYSQGIIPHMIIGDLDSISTQVRSHFEKTTTLWQKFPREKDNTDADLAIQYALDKQVDEIIIFGLFGDRIDHMLSNIFHISEIAQNKPCRMIEGNMDMYIVRDKVILNGKKGDELSLIPLKGDCERITTRGLYYPLQQEDIPFGSTRGISNVFLKEKVEIQIRSGVLLVVHRHS